MSAMIEPFILAVPDADLEDLRARLRATRWPEPATHPGQGVALERLQERCARWAHGYDWRATERSLNAVPQFITTIDGLRIHFLHARSSSRRLPAGPHARLAGQRRGVPRRPAAAHRRRLRLRRPSLPGYGLSGKPTNRLGRSRIARAWATLMARLGYARYGAQGTDWGTSVGASLGQQDREHVAGIHLMPPLAPTATMGRQADDDTGYSTQHRTRPQTVGYALTDSPAGLAAWIGEKLGSWSDPRTPIPEHRILDTLMLFWLTRTAASSARLYWESLGDVTRWLNGPLEPGDRVDAPTGCTLFPHELQRPTATRPPHASRTSFTGASPSAADTSPRSSSPTRSRPSSRLLRARPLTARCGARRVLAHRRSVIEPLAREAPRSREAPARPPEGPRGHTRYLIL